MKTLSVILISMILMVTTAFDATCETDNIPAPEKAQVLPFKISSPAFAAGDKIPVVYTCSGSNYSPALQWSNPPKGAKSFVVILEDPDAPLATFTHWVICGIPGDQTGLAEKISPKGNLPKGAIEGRNDFGTIGYAGPCPPPGTPHRYTFKVYALDSVSPFKPGANKDNLVKYMKDHTLGQAEMIGLFGK